MRIDKIKDYWRKRVDNEFVEFIEHLENELKPFAKMTDYNYKHSNETNYHTYAFEIKEPLTNESIRKIEKIINTYDEGSVTTGTIHLGDIYVLIVASD